MHAKTMVRGLCLLMVVFVGSSCAPVDAPLEKPAGTSADAGDAPALQVCYDRGMKAAESGDWETAREAFSDGIELAPSSPAVLFHAARASARLGETETCRSHLEKAVRLGATTDLAADEAYADVIDLPEFQDLAQRLLANGAPHPAAEIIHEFADAELWPEGIAYDSATGDIYVGSIHRRAIFRLTPAGAVEELGTSSKDELMEVLGIWVDAERRALWAATGEGEFREPFDGPPRRNELVRYNLDTARLDGRWPVPDDELRLLNDVATGPDGTAWATDTVRGELYRVGPEGELELFHRYPDLVFLNGIAVSPDDGAVYLGHFAGLSVVSPEDGSIEEIQGHDVALGMVDGLSYTAGRLVLVQNSHRVNFRVVRVDLADDGLEAEHLEILPSGLPDGLIPYTSAIAGDSVVVVAASFLELMDDGQVPPAPVVARMPLDP
ncbi:MAG: SMP-30/gluconolactonase/LRE family protein [Candidatus Sulfomarinibacteraceae bacterium]